MAIPNNSSDTYAAALRRGTSDNGTQQKITPPTLTGPNNTTTNFQRPRPVGPRLLQDIHTGNGRRFGMNRGRGGGNFASFQRQISHQHPLRALPQSQSTVSKQISSRPASKTPLTRGSRLLDGLKQITRRIAVPTPSLGCGNGNRGVLPTPTPDPTPTSSPYPITVREEELQPSGTLSLQAKPQTAEGSVREQSLGSQPEPPWAPLPPPSGLSMPQHQTPSQLLALHTIPPPPSGLSMPQHQMPSHLSTPHTIALPQRRQTSLAIPYSGSNQVPSASHQMIRPPPGFPVPQRSNSEPTPSHGQIHQGNLHEQQQHHFLQHLATGQLACQIPYGQQAQQQQQQQRQQLGPTTPIGPRSNYSSLSIPPPPGFGRIPMGANFSQFTPPTTIRPPPGFGFPFPQLASSSSSAYPRPHPTPKYTAPIVVKKEEPEKPEKRHPHTVTIDDKMILWSIIEWSSEYMKKLRALIPPIEELESVGYLTKPDDSHPSFQPTPTDEERKKKHGRFGEVRQIIAAYKVIALDCEMAQGATDHNVLTKLTAIDYFTGKPIINKLVDPSPIEIVNWRTAYSGVTQEMMENAIRDGEAIIGGWKGARELLWKFMTPDTILVMHGGKNDLHALKMIHLNVVDTYITEFKLRRQYLQELKDKNEGSEISTDTQKEPDYATTGGYSGLGFDGCDFSSQESVMERDKWSLSLKKLIRMRFGRDVQKGEGGIKGHDSYEDAMAARELVHIHVAYCAEEMNLRFDHHKQDLDQKGAPLAKDP